MTRPIAFSGNTLDRDERHRRDAPYLAKALQEDSTRILPVWKLAPLVREGDERRLAWATPAILDGHIGPEPVFLGVADGRAHFALDLSAVANPLVDFGWEGAAAFPDLRATVGLLPPGDGGIAAQARQIVDWHARHGFCPNCGEKTRPKDGGWSRICTACSSEHFPRTDPVVIMLVIDGDRCLLGRQPGWPKPMVSALAGFVEAGETLEEAVRREVREEAGVQVGAIRYVASQPWPFPASLMIGCEAEAVSRRIQIDTNELESADWFTRDEVKAALVAPTQRLGVPPPIAIAHHLIQNWVAR
jgi:NAD+ diphosphatase